MKKKCKEKGGISSVFITDPGGDTSKSRDILPTLQEQFAEHLRQRITFLTGPESVTGTLTFKCGEQNEAPERDIPPSGI